MNRLTDHERVRAGRAREQAIYDAARAAGLDLMPATDADDRHRKVDAWLPGNTSVQIKTRDRADRTDLGLAIFRPYDRRTRTGPPDRDWKVTPDRYLTTVRGQLFMCNGRLTHRIVQSLLRAPEGYRTRYGSELRVTTDQGQGYAQGQLKLMAYLSIHDLVRHAQGAFL